MATKVKDLIKFLEEVDPEAIVVMSSDAEGNSYKLFNDAFLYYYEAESSWYGRIGIKELTPDLEEEGYGEVDVLENPVKCVVLSPM